MTTLTSSSFVEALRASNLLAPAQLDALAGGRGADSRALARQLVQQGWLTPFQVNQLLQGRGADLVLGPYVLLERLGQGGMGQVFKARQRRLNRIVALKVIRRECADDTEAMVRFQREIAAVAGLSHPNIVRAFDAGEDHGTLYFVMEYLAGRSLAAEVERSGPVPAPLACEYMRQAALALHHIHDHGLIHRDIKPSNLFLEKQATAEGPAYQVKVLDLGLGSVR